MQHLLVYTLGNLIAPMLLGFVLSMLIRFACKSTPPLTRRAILRKSAEWLDNASLKILLPIFVISIVNKSTLEASMLAYVSIGIALPILTYVSSRWIKSALALPKGRQFATEDFRLAVSTYGGGNRGTLVCFIFLSQLPDFSKYLLAFALLDLGHTIYMVFLLPFVVRHHYQARPARDGGFKSQLMSVLSSYAFIVALWTLIYVSATSLHLVPHERITLVLDDTEAIRKVLFSTLLFASLFLKAKGVELRLSTTIRDLLGAATLRVLAGIGCLLASWLLGRPEIMIAVLILISMPPSSMLPSVVDQVAGVATSESGLDAVVVRFNVAFMTIIIVVVLAKALGSILI